LRMLVSARKGRGFWAKVRGEGGFKGGLGLKFDGARQLAQFRGRVKLIKGGSKKKRTPGKKSEIPAVAV